MRKPLPLVTLAVASRSAPLAIQAQITNPIPRPSSNGAQRRDQGRRALA